MKMRAGEMVQRGHAYSIVDEVNSILIDEARTPLIISGPIEDRAELYNAVDDLMKQLVVEHDKIEKELVATNGKERLQGADQDAMGSTSSTRSSARYPSPRPATSASRTC